MELFVLNTKKTQTNCMWLFVRKKKVTRHCASPLLLPEKPFEANLAYSFFYKENDCSITDSDGIFFSASFL